MDTAYVRETSPLNSLIRYGTSIFGKQLDNYAFQIGSPGTKNQGKRSKIEIAT